MTADKRAAPATKRLVGMTRTPLAPLEPSEKPLAISITRVPAEFAVRLIERRFTVSWPAVKGDKDSRPPPPSVKLWAALANDTAVALGVTNCSVPPLRLVKEAAVAL